MIEEWRIIKDYPNYQANNFGRIKSLKLQNEKKKFY